MKFLFFLLKLYGILKVKLHEPNFEKGSDMGCTFSLNSACVRVALIPCLFSPYYESSCMIGVDKHV